MTKINRLTQLTTLEDSDLSVVWQDSSGRTRAITIADLRNFIQSTDPNADAFVKAELVGDELILTSHDETETKIDINILPQHSVTELNDMPDDLISGYYLKVNDAGTDFVLTPASETSTTIIIEENGLFQGTANVINFDDLQVEITNRIARVSTKPVSGADGEIMKVENGKLVPSGVMSNKDGSLSLSSGSVDIGPHTISSSGEGIEATNESSGESFSFVFAGQGDDAGPVDRVFGDESVIKTTEDLSLQLTNHTSKLTATAQTRIIKHPITIKPVAPQTNVTMQITDLNGSDLWTYGPFDIDIDENGDFKFTISTVLDFKVGEYLVTFLSPDGDVTLYGGASPISGEQVVYGELPFKPFHDETLHNIKNGGEIVREIEAGENVTTELVDGKLTISSEGADLPENPTFKSVSIDTTGSGQPNFTASIHQDNELHTVIDATRELRVNYKDVGTGTTTGVMGIDNNQAQFLVPIYQGNDAVALAKDVPVIPDNGYVEKYTRADLDYVHVAYQGKYGGDRIFYPVSFSQDVNGWTQLKFTGNMVFHCNSKDTGSELSKPFEIRQSKVVHNVQPYYGDHKLAVKGTHHIATTASFNDVITTGGKTVSEWITENPDYTPSQLLDVIFDSKVLGEANWVVSITTSNNTYNGTIPSGYSQWELHKTGGSARNFMRVYHKESHTVYFAPYLEGQEPVWKRYAYQEDVSTEIDDKIAADKSKGIWIGGVFKDTLNDDGHSGDQFDCGDPKHFIEFRKTGFQGDRFLVRQRTAVKSSEITIHLHPESGMTSCPFRVVTSDGKYRDRTIRVNEKWRFWLREGTYPWAERIDDGTASYVSEEQVQQIVSKSFDSLIEPGEGTDPISKHPLPNQQGYLSTYSSVMYDADDRLVIPRNAYDKTLMELFFEANKSAVYCTIPVATVELIMGRILRPEDIELGVALDELTAITPGIYGATTPSNVPSTWAWNGKFIPLNTEAGEHNDPNNPTVWLSQDGDYVYSESEAGDKPKYGQMNVSDLMSKDGQTWRHALRRGYIMKDGSFVFNAESPYYVFVIRISGYQTPQSKIHTVFFNRGGIKLYPDAISAYVDQEKIRDQLDELSEGLAQGFIYAKEVSVG